MKKIISQCFGCDISCINCGRKNIPVRVCNQCQIEQADYIVDDEDYCQDCLTEKVRNEFIEMIQEIKNYPDMYLKDYAELLGHEVEELEK